MPGPPIRVAAGFCVQTESTGPGSCSRWFINVTKHKLVGMPVAHSGAAISKDWILTHGIGNMSVPFDLGTCRKLKARAEGAKQTTYCIDVVFNPFIVQLFTDDEFCHLMEHYRPFVLNLVLKRIEESVGIKLAMQKVKLVKGTRYKDGEGSDGSIPKDFTELATDFGADEEEAENQPPPSLRLNKEESGEDSASGKPLIEEVAPANGSAKPKRVIKKGFLNRSDKKPLYGPEGSKEGVVPENAGDPMGWMPKRLRENSKIVDCNSPEYQAHQKQVEAANESNRVNQEFKNLIEGDMKAAERRSRHSLWSEDTPDGPEVVTSTPANPASKYDLDYSRFENLDIDEDENPQQVRSKPSSAAKPAATREREAAPLAKQVTSAPAPVAAPAPIPPPAEVAAEVAAPPPTPPADAESITVDDPKPQGEPTAPVAAAATTAVEAPAVVSEPTITEAAAPSTVKLVLDDLD